MERGYVKLYRKTLDSGLLQNPAALQLFIYLLLNATRKPRKQIVSGMAFELQPGDVVVSRAKLAAELELSDRNVRTALALLEKTSIVTSRATNKSTVISLVNWGRYQEDCPAERPAERPTGRPTPDQQTAPHHLNKQERENIKKKVPKEKPDVLEGLSDRMRGAVQAFSEHRKGMKAPLTEQALKLTLSKLEQLAPGDEATQVAILEQSVQRGWKGVFALKEEGQAAMPTPRYEWQSPAQRRLNANMEAAQAFIHDG